MTDPSWAQVVEQLEVPWELDEGDVVTDLILIAKIVDENGNASFVPRASPGTDFVTIIGLLTLAEREAGSFLVTTVQDDGET